MIGYQSAMNQHWTLLLRRFESTICCTARDSVKQCCSSSVLNAIPAVSSGTAFSFIYGTVVCFDALVTRKRGHLPVRNFNLVAKFDGCIRCNACTIRCRDDIRLYPALTTATASSTSSTSSTSVVATKRQNRTQMVDTQSVIDDVLILCFADWHDTCIVSVVNVDRVRDVTMAVSVSIGPTKQCALNG